MDGKKEIFFVDSFRDLGNESGHVCYEVIGKPVAKIRVGDILSLQPDMSRLRIEKIICYGHEVEDLDPMVICKLIAKMVDTTKRPFFTIFD